MTETNITRALTALSVAGIIWCVSSIATLITTVGMQDVYIENILATDTRLLATQNIQGERIADVESKLSGLSVSFNIIIKNQDRILNKLDGG